MPHGPVSPSVQVSCTPVKPEASYPRRAMHHVLLVLDDPTLVQTTSGVAKTGFKIPGLGTRSALLCARGTPLSKIRTTPSTPAATTEVELPATGTTTGLPP